MVIILQIWHYISKCNFYNYCNFYIDEVEKCLKNVLTTRQYRKRKEFYQIDLDVLKELINNCNNMSLKVRKVNKNIKQEGGFFIMLDKND